MIASTNCFTCLNENCLIKRNCLSHEKTDLLDRKHTIKVKKSQHFIVEGAPVHGLFFVYNGTAKVTKTGVYGKDQILRFAKNGDIIGHRGFAVGDSYGISAVALEDSVLCNFDNETLSELLNSIPTFTLDLLKFYALELNRSETQVRKLAQMSVREKVVDSLLFLSEKFGQELGFIALKVSRREIADFAGTTEEQVIRVLSSLKKEKLIETVGKQIKLVEVTKLQQEISEHTLP